MKKGIFLFLYFLFALSMISALEINMDSEIDQGQTILASVSGNFIDPITDSSVLFYRGHVRISLNFNVAKIGDDYYIYAQSADKLPNNYSIVIRGVRYMVGAQVSQADIVKNFTITEDTADFSVTPGLLITDGNFSFKLQNLQESEITINIDTIVDSGSSNGFFGFFFEGAKTGDSIVLRSGQIKYLQVSLDDITETTIRTISLSSANLEYKIPVYVIKESSQENPSENETEPPLNDTTIPEEQNETSVNCSWFEQLFGCPTENETSVNTINKTTTNETKKNETDYEVVVRNNKTVVIKDGVVLDEPATLKTCAEIKGDICSSGEICQNQTIYAKDSKCCISSCIKQETKKNSKIIGWIIIAVIFILILWFFRVKFRETKKKKDALLNPQRKPFNLR